MRDSYNNRVIVRKVNTELSISQYNHVVRAQPMVQISPVLQQTYSMFVNESCNLTQKVDTTLKKVLKWNRCSNKLLAKLKTYYKIWLTKIELTESWTSNVKQRVKRKDCESYELNVTYSKLSYCKNRIVRLKNLTL